MLMRILVLTTSFPADDADPAGNFIRRLSEAWAERGHRVRVVVPERRGATGPGRLGRVAAVRFRYGWGRWRFLLTSVPGGIPEALRRRRRAAWQMPALTAAFVRAACARARWADVLYANWLGAGAAGVLAGAWARRPVVLTLRGDDAYWMRDYVFWRVVGRSVFRGCAAVTAVSRPLARLVQPYMPRGRTVEVPHFGVDTRQFHPPAEPRPPGERPDGLFVGNLSRAKGVDVLLRALAARPGRWGRFAFVGDGPDEPALRRQADELGLAGRLDWLGRLPPDQVPGRMRGADFLVLPSRSEGRPNVVLEALASGLPVIATRVGGTADLLGDGGHGLVVPAGEPAALAEAIDRLAGDGGLRARLGAAGRQYVLDNDLTWQRTAREFEAIFERARAAGPSRGRT